jgi:hypothetical protein
MSERGLPQEVRQGIAAVSSATAELAAAARDADPEGIQRALERRASAIESLEQPMLELRRRTDAAGRRRLLDEKEMLEREAAGALEALQKLAVQMRSALEEMGRNATALRSYTASSSPAATLDRST